MSFRSLLLCASLLTPLAAKAGDPSPERATTVARAGVAIGGLGLATATASTIGEAAGCYSCEIPALAGNIAFNVGDMMLLGGTGRAAALMQRRGSTVSRSAGNLGWGLWAIAQTTGLLQVAARNDVAATTALGIAGGALNIGSYAAGVVQLRRNDLARPAKSDVNVDAPAPRPYVQVAPSFQGGRVGVVVGGVF